MQTRVGLGLGLGLVLGLASGLGLVLVLVLGLRVVSPVGKTHVETRHRSGRRYQQSHCEEGSEELGVGTHRCR